MSSNITNNRLLDIYINYYYTTLDRINYLYYNLENSIQIIERLSFQINNDNRNHNNHNNNRNNRNNNNNNRNNNNRNRIRNTHFHNNDYNINNNTNNRNNRNNSNRYDNIYNNINQNSNQNSNQNINQNSNQNNVDIDLSEFVSNFFNSIPVVPTLQEIINSTRVVRYDSINEPLNESCPISLENFRNDEYVTQINFCGHIFKSDQLNNWFTTNVRCPVCRYDIRNATTNTTINTSSIPITRSYSNRRNRRNLLDQSIQSNYNSVINNLTQQLSSSLLNSNNTDNDRLLVDTSNNILIYETFLQFPNNNLNMNNER